MRPLRLFHHFPQAETREERFYKVLRTYISAQAKYDAMSESLEEAIGRNKAKETALGSVLAAAGTPPPKRRWFERMLFNSGFGQDTTEAERLEFDRNVLVAREDFKRDTSYRTARQVAHDSAQGKLDKVKLKYEEACEAAPDLAEQVDFENATRNELGSTSESDTLGSDGEETALTQHECKKDR
jgi:hypothetical protein